jgi:hypothetical protein
LKEEEVRIAVTVTEHARSAWLVPAFSQMTQLRSTFGWDGQFRRATDISRRARSGAMSNLGAEPRR